MASRCSTMRTHAVVLAPHDPAVAGGVGDPGGEHGAGGARSARCSRDERGDRLGPQQRRVAGQHEDVAVVVEVVVGEAGEPDGDGVAGAALDVLLDELEAQAGAVLAELLGDPLGAVADDDHRPADLAVAGSASRT